MARLSFPTEARIPGPLLIDANQLQGLDQLIDGHIDALRREREHLIAASTEKEIGELLANGLLRQDQIADKGGWVRESVARRLEREARSVTIYLPRGKAVHAKRFAEAMSHPLGEEEAPSGFLLNLKVAAVEVRVGVNSPWSEDLRIDVDPNDVGVAQELFGALRNWASDVEAPKWQQRWSALNPVFGLLFYLWILGGLVLFPLATWSTASKDLQKSEARKLLASGINPSNQQRALELLLAIESDYHPGAPTSSLGLRYWGYFGLGAIFLGAACICPKTSIGIWRGKQNVKRWRLWIKTATVTVPVLIVTSILLPWLLHWLNLAPPSH